ncbi:hypothetical protein BUALT_Bualt17G0004900 [Buddleja alternifolia]|uniref:LysM domain-containing protein n=1 Tax=Buddleja alternifolia TaxID=168488 RepID=A0AAV6WFQ9_9LAMI|nr:hypothetical protein BUALT_Bualt17G0004900 [Buddleja alternifolia]
MELDPRQPPPVTVTPNRNNKKLKRNYVGATTPSRTDPIPEETTAKQQLEGFAAEPTAPKNSWDTNNLQDTWKRKIPEPAVYTGEEEDDDTDKVFDKITGSGDDEDDYTIPTEELRVMAAPYRRALVVKVLGRKIGYGMLKQRMKTIWQLSNLKGKQRTGVDHGTTKEAGFNMSKFTTNNFANMMFKAKVPTGDNGQGKQTNTRVRQHYVRKDQISQKQANVASTHAPSTRRDTQRTPLGTRFDILNDLEEDMEHDGVDEFQALGKEGTSQARRRLIPEGTPAQEPPLVDIELVPPLAHGNTYPITNNRINPIFEIGHPSNSRDLHEGVDLEDEEEGEDSEEDSEDDDSQYNGDTDREMENLIVETKDKDCTETDNPVQTRMNGNNGEIDYFLSEGMEGSSSSPSRLPPVSSPPSTAVAIGVNGGAKYILHTVSKFDTLAGVAIKYGVEVADIKRLNGLVTDLQMFALKTLQIPLPGRHPPSPSLCIADDTPKRPSTSEQTPSIRRHSDLFDSFQSLKLKSSSKQVSPAMSSLQGYYGLSQSDQKPARDGFEMAVYNRKGGSHYLEDGPFSTSISNRPLSHQRKSKSVANVFMSENGGLLNPLLSQDQEADNNNSRWIEKLLRRRQKSEADFSCRTPEKLLKEENSSSGSAISAITGKGLALRPKSGGGPNPIPINLGDSFVMDNTNDNGVRKSSSTSSLQESSDNNGNNGNGALSMSSIWPTLSTAAMTRPIFDNLPKPIGRRNKKALD